MSDLTSFSDLAVARDPLMDLLALAIAQEFRDVDAGPAVAMLDALGAELRQSAFETSGDANDIARACGQLLG